MKKIYFICIGLLISILSAYSQDLTGIKILVNPGHGGFDSDDRNIVIKPFAAGDHDGFWESQSNFDKGIQLRDLLKSANAEVVMSRLSNNPTLYDDDGKITYTDDTPLTQIVAMANQADVDFMLSIHSNAGVTNYVLQLYAGKDLNDTHTYPTAIPFSDESRAVGTLIGQNLYSNQVNTWAAGIQIVGDKTYARTAMGWSDGYGVLRGLRVPGCLSEGSMHDYIPETYRLMNMEYKWLEAWHFFKSFCEYFEAGEIVTGNIAGSVHDSRNLNMESYTKIRNSKDELLPIHGAKITLNPGNQVYTTDDLYNGVFVFKQLQPGNYTVKVEADNYYTQEETLVVEKNKTTYFNCMLNMVRSTPPEVIEYSPKVSLDEPVECSTKIIFEFNWDMDVETTAAAFSITPHTEGEITFEDSQHRMVFTPTIPFETNTVYTVTLAGTAKHPDNMAMGEDFTFSFTTKDRNRLVALAGYPSQGSNVCYTGQIFEYRFDNVLYTMDIADKVNVYDKDGNILPKVARSLSHNKIDAPYGSTSFQLQNNLVIGEEYKVVLESNLKDVVLINLVTPVEYTFKAVDIRVTDKTVAESFDANGTASYNASQSEKIASASVARSTSTKLFGTAASEFKYSFAESEGGKAVYEFATSPLKVTASKVLGVHIYGDLNDYELGYIFKNGDEAHVVKFADLNFIGWKFKEVALTTLREGKEYDLIGIQITQKAGGLMPRGSFFLDDLLVYDELINSIPIIDAEEMFKVYPNPVKDRIYVTYQENELVTLTLYAPDGTLVRKSIGTEMSVEGLNTGIYLLKIKAGTHSAVRRIIVVD